MIVSIPTLQKPTIHEVPTIKLIEKPEPQVTILSEMKYYVEACEAWKVVGEEGRETIEDMAIEYTGLTKQDACGFALYGLPTQKWLNLELDIGTTTAGIEQLRILLNSANRNLMEQYEIITKATEEIKETLKGGAEQ